jgi:hypothetical protein
VIEPPTRLEGCLSASVSRCLVFVLVLLVLAATRTEAQPDPSDSWRTIETPHFLIHFNPPLEEFARRSAISAERAYAFLARELVPPRGKIDLVIADNIDYANGYATPFPSNRIVIFAHPPVEDPALRNYEDWSSLVISHELTHIFHLDRARGIWRVGRAILGRHPSLFPNTFQPAWVTEGLAVYFESRITGAGRLEGSEHYMIVNAAAESGRFPRLGEVSRATTRFPAGETVYAYGGFIFDYIARTRGERAIHDFVEVSSKRLLPLTLNGKARSAFGVTFDRAFGEWRDSLIRAAARPAPPMPGWKQLTNEGWYVGDPRWSSSSTIIYSASTGKDVTAAYTITTAGQRSRLGRRNGIGANIPLPNGDFLFSQPEFTDPYRIRNDLYLQRGGRQIKLTRAARVSAPDLRRDGQIVAVQNVAASTRLVRIAPDGRQTRVLAEGNLDLQWGDPRWNPAGNLIAAVRIPRGSVSEIVVLDTLGRILDARPFSRAIAVAPTWSPDGQRVYFSSDHSGVMQVYSFAPRDRSAEIVRHSSATTGMFFPEVAPGDSAIAAVHYRVDGYHLGFAPVSSLASARADTVAATVRRSCADCRVEGAGPGPAARSDAIVRSYSPWRSLAPHYWEPVLATSTESGTSVGIATSGNDVIGRHSYVAQASYNTRHHDGEGFVGYQYAGLGQPVLSLSGEIDRQHSNIFTQSGRVVGDLAQLSRIASVSAAIARPRVRTFASAAAGVEIEDRGFASDPDTLLAHLPPVFRDHRTLTSAIASASWSNTRRPLLSISREDGIALSALVRERWRNDGGSPSTSVTGVTAAYKSLDLPGFAHHVLAFRAAGGWADANATSSFSVGGLSGGSLDVIAGFAIGAERRTFGVRGFPPSSERGNRAFAGTLEYRAPIAPVSRRIPVVPVLLDRLAAAAFVEAGRAYCAPGDATSVCAGPVTNNPMLASAGAELYLDTALQYDVPARFRAGLAAPIHGRDFAGAKKVSFYLTFGSAF